jgi:nickel transport protein
MKSTGYCSFLSARITLTGVPLVACWFWRSLMVHSHRLALIALLLISFAAHGHRMDHVVSQDEAMVVSLSFGHGHPPSHETFRIYAPDQDVAFQNGRTDAFGRLSFLPDRPGTWRVVVSTDDGHGLELAIDVDESMTVMEVISPGHTHWGLVVAGIGYLFGVAGLLVLWRNRKSATGTG